MSSVGIVVLGVLAGATIFIGLPIGRLRNKSTSLRATLNAVTVGILLFLLWDVLTHAVDPLELALTEATTGSGWGPFGALAIIFFGSLAVGLLGLVSYDQWMTRRAHDQDSAVGTSASTDRSSASNRTDVAGFQLSGPLRLREPASRLAFLIAVGIGLHNFSEGLAIGQSAASGQINLALVLVVGFGLHNATEGFGITAPLAGDSRRPSWLQLFILGVIAGGPTFVGTILGQVFINDFVSTAFLALAAGSIIYVILQLVGVALRFGKPAHLYVGLLIGLFAGFATDFVIAAAGV
ncbi:ZIP family metal transporter [Subtercola endophyticus]|uniref:ZIP family metal transporter n=1 Tax=Subtercola endophyticus TaxID=2895559 RepID=UPI001E41A21C|nr:ZIP family metal transporter [Subtercola endophyticus]UFS59619.1 ZIP family metal transporter [Subtercola endophyticus]